MSKIRLGVNIDHVATVRNARGEKYPSPLEAAILAEKCGAHSVTIHLREDRRHINDLDLKEIKSKLKLIKPKTLGQALRIDGVTPAAAIILLAFIKKSRYKVSA